MEMNGLRAGAADDPYPHNKGYPPMDVSAKNIRNIAVVGHSGEGKTLLCEAMLYNAGAIERMGKIENGTTVCDFDEQEIARGSSVSLAVAYLLWKGVKFNLLDVPGFYDFEGEFISAMRAAGAALVVMGAGGTVTVGAEKAIDYCFKNKKPMIVFINGMDKENAAYHGTVQALQEKYKGKIAPIQIPVMEGEKMTGYINVITGTAYKFADKGVEEIPVPAAYQSELEEMQALLQESAAENDETLLEKYFEDGALSAEDTVLGLRKGIQSISVVPVLAGSALANKGVINLMNEIVNYVPEAAEREGLPATDLKSKEHILVACTESAPAAAQVFKTAVDPFVGKMNYIRVCRGVLKTGADAYNPNTDTTERINSLYLARGKKLEPVTSLTAGDIGVVAKLTNTGTGDTLCDPNAPVQFDPIVFPEPVLAMAVSATVRGSEDKVFGGLHRLSEEDKSFQIRKNTETGETLACGQGEIQLEIIKRKLKAKFGADAEFTTPTVAYRETVTGKAEAEGKHKKQSGGAGQFGVVNIRFEPGAADGVFEFVDATIGGSVPKQFIPAVEKGLREAIQKGVLAGFPMVDLKATLFDGKSHPVDSKEVAFVSAAKLAYDDGVRRARPVILEPVCSMKIVVPEQYVGDIMGDLNKRRGRIIGMDTVDGLQVITAEAPEGEILTYATSLRSMTQGRGKFSQEFARYEQAPESVLQSLNK